MRSEDDFADLARAERATGLATEPDIPWLQPFPDQALEPAGPSEAEPEAAAVTRETIELAFLAAIQHLPPRQRAVLILRDVLGWSVSQAATTLDTTSASVNSALQRARATLKENLAPRRMDWAATAVPTAEERMLLRRYMDAVEQADLAAMGELLAAEVRATMPPFRAWYAGREDLLAALAASWDPAARGYVGRFRMVPVGVNRQPGAAAYVSRGGPYHAFALGVLVVEAGRITELTAFHQPELFPRFGLPMTFPGPDRLNRYE